MAKSVNSLVLLTLAFLFCHFVSPAQHTLEKLRHQFEQEKGASRIETGLQIGDSLTDNPEEHLSFSLSLLEEARSSGVGRLLMSRVLRQVADGYYYNDSLRLSAEYLVAAVQLAEGGQPVDSLFTGSILNDLGIIYTDLGKRKDAELILEKAVQFLRSSGDRSSLADAFSNLGTLHHQQGKYNEAILNFQLAYQTDLETGNISRQSSSLNNLARIYVDWGKYETGLDYYFRSAELLDTLKDQPTLSIRYNNIGMVYHATGNYREAITWIDKARTIDENRGLLLRLGSRYLNLAASWEALGNFSKAAECLEKAESYCLMTGQTPILTKVYAGLGQHHFNRGNHALALNYYLKSLENAEVMGSLTEKANSYNHLYFFHKTKGESKEALHYFELLTSARDSIYNLEVSKKVEELEVQYQTAGKEAEISRLESENELRIREVTFRRRERNWALAGLVLLIGFLAGLYRLFSTVRKQKTALAMQNLELDRLNKTQNRLFGIISHDLRNATSAYQSSARLIFHFLKKGEPEKLIPLAPEISKNAGTLSEMLDNLLQWSLLQMKGIEPEKKLLNVKQESEKVVELMREYALGKSNSVVLEMDNETVWCDQGSFHLIMRNLLSNAIKFTSGGRICIRAYSEEGMTVIEVADSGCGMESTILDGLFETGMKEVRRGTGGERGTGLGMGLVSEHVARNRGTVSARSKPGKGSVIIVKLPAQELWE